MDNEKLIVKAKQVKLGRTLLGGVQVVYPCPRCKDELTTKNDVSLGDMCPRCKTWFEFDDEIKHVFAKFEAQKKQQAEPRVASQAEQEKLRQAKQEELARAKVEQEAMPREEMARADAEQRRQEADQSRQLRYLTARDLDRPVACMRAVLGIGFIGTVMMVIAGMSSTPTDIPLLGAAAGSAASLTVVYVFFSILRAIHFLILEFVDELRSSSGRS